MVSVSHIYCWQIAPLYCFCLGHAPGLFNLGQTCQRFVANIWKPAYYHQPVLCSLIKHVVSANQSARYMKTVSFKNQIKTKNCLRLGSHVSGYFWIRNFFFPDSDIFQSTSYRIPCQLPQSRFYKQIHAGMARTFANRGNSASPKRNSALHSSSVTRVKSKRSYDQ